jgi:mono/diheme cytochrome c family protein
MKMKLNITTKVAYAAVAIFLLGACNADKDSPGLEYMPDMYRSPAIEPYVDYGLIKERINEDLKTELTSMTPPFGAIPYYGTDSATVAMMLPYHRLPNEAFSSTHGLTNTDFTSEDSYALAANDVNPLTLTEDNADAIFKTGKSLFNSNCAHCHGEEGNGEGPMVKSGAYAGVPDYANLTNLSDGQIFYSIYYGKGMMGAHGSLLNKKEIWTLVHYVRKFQNSDYGPGNTSMQMEGGEEAAEETTEETAE